MDRIAPLEPPFEPAVDEQLRSMMPAGVEPIALFRTFAKNLAAGVPLEPGAPTFQSVAVS